MLFLLHCRLSFPPLFSIFYCNWVHLELSSCSSHSLKEAQAAFEGTQPALWAPGPSHPRKHKPTLCPCCLMSTLPSTFSFTSLYHLTFLATNVSGPILSKLILLQLIRKCVGYNSLLIKMWTLLFIISKLLLTILLKNIWKEIHRITYSEKNEDIFLLLGTLWDQNQDSYKKFAIDNTAYSLCFLLLLF